MPGFYLYFRCWPGFTDRFPFDKFNGLPDTEIQGALDKFARHWITKNQAKLDAREEVHRRRDLGQPMTPTKGRKNAASERTRRRVPLIYEIGSLAGWIATPAILDTEAPIPREFFLRIDGEEDAAQIVEVLQDRMGQSVLVPCFGYVPEDDLEITERVSIELAIDDVQHGIGAGPLSSRERMIAAAAKRVTEKLELIKTRTERNGEGESVQPSLTVEPNDTTVDKAALNTFEESIVQALSEKGQRMTTEPLLKKAVGKVNSHGKATLASLRKRGIIDNKSDAHGKGYGLPSWSGP